MVKCHLPCACAILFLGALTGCASTGQGVDTGAVEGDALLTNLAADAVAFLNANPVVSGGTVRFYRKTSYGSSLASNAAQAENTWVVPTTRKVASYQIDVPLNETNEFLSVLNSVRFDLPNSLVVDDHATYRLGTQVTDPAAPAAQACGPVPIAMPGDPRFQCDMAECAALVSVRFKVTGSDADIDGLEPTLPGFICTATAKVAEQPGGSPNSSQATLTRRFPRDDLRGVGQLAEFLVRADGSEVAISGSCNGKPQAGQENYPLTSTGLTDFSNVAITPATFTLPCPTAGGTPPPEVVIEVMVERNAGNLTGYFDLSGQTEASSPLVSVLGTSNSTFAQSVPAAQQPSQKWVITGIPEGDYRVYAEGRTDVGDMYARFPYAGEVGGPIHITRATTTDLGSTFVARPRLAEGIVGLYDFSGETDLASIEMDESYMTALGESAVVDGPDGLPAGSGEGGIARGYLQGAFDPAAGSAEAGYRLPLTGLSPVNGTLDGSDGKWTQWSVKDLRLRMEPGPGPLVWEATSIDLNRFLPLLYTPPTSTDNASLQVPRQDICFGAIEVTMSTQPGTGLLFRPRLRAPVTGVTATTTTIPGAVYSATGDSRGIPTAQTGADLSATARLTLPEGIQYPIRPKVDFLAPDGTVSNNLALPELTLPPDGILGCGEKLVACLSNVGSDGSYVPLAVGVDPTPQSCQPNDSFAFDVSVDSGGTDVDAVLLYVDDAAMSGPPTVLCTSCGANPGGLNVDASSFGLGPGDHDFTIRAISALGVGCDGIAQVSFRIPDQPLTLQCTPLVDVALEATETSIAADDSRVAPALTPQVIGDSCGVPTDVTPHLADIPPFPVGETQVVFSLSEPDYLIPTGGATCTTTVRVSSAPLLAFRSRTSDPTLPTEYRINLHSVLDNTVALVQHTDPQPFFFTYDRSGERMTIISNDAGVIRMIDTATGGILETRPVPTGYRLYNADFNPVDASKFAIVGTEIANSDQHAIFIFADAAQPPSRFDLPLFAPSLRISRPLISWSPDGSKISAAFTDPAPAVDEYGLIVTEWNVVNDQITLPPEGIFQQRPGLPNREIIREVVYQDPDWRAVGSDKTITRAIKRPTIEQILPIYGQLNTGLDLTEDGRAAALIYSIPLAPGSQGIVWGVEPLDQNALPTVHQGPTIYDPTRVAISSDAAYVAVASDQPGPVDKVFVFSFPDFTLIKEIDTHRPTILRFRPR